MVFMSIPESEKNPDLASACRGFPEGGFFAFFFNMIL